MRLRLTVIGVGLLSVMAGFVVLVAGLSGQTPACAGAASLAAVGATGSSSGGWLATAYGPPWGGINGDGVTATGVDLTAGPPMYEVAVDPSVIALGSYVYVEPNPFGTSSAFYAGDTGGAINGQHVDIYDWQGRASQDAWGAREVSVTLAAAPGAGNAFGAVTTVGATAPAAPSCSEDGSVGLTAAQTAQIEPDGSALAPTSAPAAVALAIAGGNLIHTYPYPVPDVHYGSLAQLWPAYDCSGAVSFVLYAAGLLGSADAETSTQLESYGLPGPGRWITLYANSTHVWIVVAGIAFDTAEFGGAPVPAGSGPRWRADALANLTDGESYVVRHPAGL